MLQRAALAGLAPQLRWPIISWAHVARVVVVIGAVLGLAALCCGVAWLFDVYTAVDAIRLVSHLAIQLHYGFTALYLFFLCSDLVLSAIQRFTAAESRLLLLLSLFGGNNNNGGGRQNAARFVSGVDRLASATDGASQRLLPPCGVCDENERRVAYVPCGHLYACFACDRKIRENCAPPPRCPVCRASIEQSIEVFIL